MPHIEIDSPSNDGAQLVASLLARIDGLMAQIAGRDERIDELLAQVKALSARIAELEAKRGGPPIRPITTRVELFRATCPCCKARVTASAPADMPEGTPFGPGIASMIAYLHGCQMIGFKRLTEVCQGLFGLTISQGAIANVLARVGEAIIAPAERIAA